MSKFLMLVVIAMGLCAESALFGQAAYRFNGNSSDLVDLDLDDGFDFVGEFAGTWTLKFATPAMTSPPVSNMQVDGGSRTVYSGAKLIDLALDTSGKKIDLVNSEFFGEYVFWDRADFNQHIIELTFQVGDSQVQLLLTADAGNGDAAFGQLFTVNTPKPNTGELAPVRFLSAMEAAANYTQPELRINAGADLFGGVGEFRGDADLLDIEVLLGDVNLDDRVSLLDVDPFLNLIINNLYQAEADING